KGAGIKPIFGTELGMNGHPLLLYVESARGYRSLNRLLSRRAERNSNEDAVAAQQRKPFAFEHLDGFTDGLIAVSTDLRVSKLFPGRFYQMAVKGGSTACLNLSNAE